MSHRTDVPTDAETQMTEPGAQALEKELTLEELALVSGGKTITIKIKLPKLKCPFKKKKLFDEPAVDLGEL